MEQETEQIIIKEKGKETEEELRLIDEIVGLFGQKKEKVIRWAQLLENRIEDHSTICSYIVKKLRERGISAWYVYDILPEKYKNQLKASVGLVRATNAAAAAELQADLSEQRTLSSGASCWANPSSSIQELYQNATTTWENLDRNRKRDLVEQLQKTKSLAEQLAEDLAERCHKDGIPPYPGEDSTVGSDGIYRDTFVGNKRDEQEQTISTEKEEPRKSESYYATLRHVEAWQAVAKKIEEFPPATPEEDLRYAKALDVATSLLDPYSDEKWRKDWPAWFKIQIDNENHGKHAAAVMNYTVTHKGIKRSLTREQVGDKAEETYQKAKMVLEHMPVYVELMYRFRHFQEPRIAYRSTELSPTLSEKS